MATRPLTPKQAAFVREYLVDLNATQAAIRAGYSAKTARASGPRMLTFVAVKAAVSSALVKQAAKSELSAEFVLSGIRSVVERCEAAGVKHSLPALKGYELLGKYLKLFAERLSLENPDGTPLVEGNALGAMAALVAAAHSTVAQREAKA